MKVKWSIFWFNPWQTLWLLVWNFFEMFSWGPFAKLAPWVFQQMIGCKGKRIKQY